MFKMKAIFICASILAAVFIGTVENQLLTPTMVCEMQCLQNLGAPQSVSYQDPRAQKCKDYCLEHAYDNLLGITTPPSGSTDKA